jgi:hypothetical protein
MPVLPRQERAAGLKPAGSRSASENCDPTAYLTTSTAKPLRYSVSGIIGMIG